MALFHSQTRRHMINVGNLALIWCYFVVEVSKGAKIRSRYNQVPQPTQDTNGKVTNSQKLE